MDGDSAEEERTTEKDARTPVEAKGGPAQQECGSAVEKQALSHRNVCGEDTAEGQETT
jgi:hypothetical protein